MQKRPKSRVLAHSIGDVYGDLGGSRPEAMRRGHLRRCHRRFRSFSGTFPSVWVEGELSRMTLVVVVEAPVSELRSGLAVV